MDSLHAEVDFGYTCQHSQTVRDVSFLCLLDLSSLDVVLVGNLVQLGLGVERLGFGGFRGIHPSPLLHLSLYVREPEYVSMSLVQLILDLAEEDLDSHVLVHIQGICLLRKVVTPHQLLHPPFLALKIATMSQ